MKKQRIASQDDMVVRALAFAVQAHHGQVRDCEPLIPYVEHPIGVMSRLRYRGGVTDAVVLSAALLHDVLEETTVTEAQLRNEFGPKVTRLVCELTRAEPSPEETEGLTDRQVWLLRSLRLLEEVSGMTDRAQAIKLADRISNLQEALSVRGEAGKRRYLAQSVAMVEVLRRKACPQLYDELRSLTQSAKMNRTGPKYVS